MEGNEDWGKEIVEKDKKEGGKIAGKRSKGKEQGKLTRGKSKEKEQGEGAGKRNKGWSREK